MHNLSSSFFEHANLQIGLYKSHKKYKFTLINKRFYWFFLLMHDLSYYFFEKSHKKEKK